MFSLRRALDDLAAHGHLVRLDDEIDPRLEAAEIQRRVYARGGPAVLYANVKGFQIAGSNLVEAESQESRRDASQQ